MTADPQRVAYTAAIIIRVDAPLAGTITRQTSLAGSVSG